MDVGADSNARSVDTVFRDFKGRRAGIIKALTTDVDEFFRQCDPEKENLCLYGYPSEHWEVNLPGEEVPPEIPEPVLGINFARDGMPEKEWLLLVAAHSDTWLLSTAFYFGARFGFHQADRKRLFDLINGMPTVFEIVDAYKRKQTKDKSSGKKQGSNNNKSKPSSKRDSNKYLESVNFKEEDEEEDVEEEEDDDDEQDNTVCGKCKECYSKDEFWICCDICETWFHGKCVRITESRAEHIKQYKCPSCSKKPRH